ncbi:response regulator receiver protein [Candidatus Koribacter versatilis Ellin345]|uniref:Response regulator receiver protein n=1 Tax=Koribacter versatilis (strain Ellin345) TaxID=204669 RepID=Q1INT7_KORVE|nr:response regulator receiver protein [Candidatus Koribacter versatilis Ellin345]
MRFHGRQKRERWREGNRRKNSTKGDNRANRRWLYCNQISNQVLNFLRGDFVPQKTLLCVDDEAVGLKVRKIILEREGYRVLTASAGVDGLTVFSEQEVDGVVLDYAMPGMNGGSVASAMKRTKPQVPIILLSAYLALPDSVMDTVDAFVVKGDAPEVLLSKIAELVRA